MPNYKDTLSQMISYGLEGGDLSSFSLHNFSNLTDFQQGGAGFGMGQFSGFNGLQGLRGNSNIKGSNNPIDIKNINLKNINFKNINLNDLNNPIVKAGAATAISSLNLANRIGGQESDTFYVNQQVKENIGGSYSGTYNQLQKVQDNNGYYNILQGSNLLGNNFGKLKKHNDNIAESEAIDYQLGQINREAEISKITNTQLNTLNYQNKLRGIDLRFAKSGLKLDLVNRAKSINVNRKINITTKQVEDFVPIISESVDLFKNGGTIEEFKPIITEPEEEFVPIITEPIDIFKEGGKTEESELIKLEETTQKNVIPEGALHKNKHHIENTEGLTQKGIPVVDNDGEQQAEIELDEIIFTLEVTKKLEELHKIYKEGSNKERDEAAIEAGKLLVQEILYNTDDRTGLISKCEKGGKL